MNFTREPILESVITPREGCKLVVRNSKSAGQEEYFVDAVEIVSFGGAHFFRSLERPKSFLVPISDYEVLETRETRVMLKAATYGEKTQRGPVEEETPKAEKKKTRRTRRRKTKEAKEEAKEEAPKEEAVKGEATAPAEDKVPSSILPPPPTLISESIGRYKEMLEMEPPTTEPIAEESGEAHEPALVPPAPADKEEVAKEVGVFSASRFLRRLTGGGEGDEE